MDILREIPEGGMMLLYNEKTKQFDRAIKGPARILHFPNILFLHLAITFVLNGAAWWLYFGPDFKWRVALLLILCNTMMAHAIYMIFLMPKHLRGRHGA